jgi:hypothetical protein
LILKQDLVAADLVDSSVEREGGHTNACVSFETLRTFRISIGQDELSFNLAVYHQTYA